MKEDFKMKDIRRGVPGGTMPQVGAMQHMQAVPKTAPAKTEEKAADTQTSAGVSPVKKPADVSPVQAPSNVSPAQTVPNVSPMQTSQNVSPMQTMQNVSPMQNMSGDMTAQTGHAGVMPSMMNQIPIMCCPYLMNMQCPLTYGTNVMGMNMMNNAMFPGVSPVSDNLMPYAGNTAPMMGTAGNNAYQLPVMGVMPSMNNQYFPQGGMNY